MENKGSKITKSTLLTIYSLLCIFSIFIMSYLLVLKLDTNATCGAQILGDCGVINRSPYSEFFNIPVALLGILWFGFGLVVALLKLKFMQNRLLTLVMLINGAWSILFSLYLIFIEAFVLREWCQYCLLTNVFILLSFIVVLFIYILEKDEKEPEKLKVETKENELEEKKEVKNMPM
jgi:uncharacterized membrane protein